MLYLFTMRKLLVGLVAVLSLSLVTSQVSVAAARRRPRHHDTTPQIARPEQPASAAAGKPSDPGIRHPAESSAAADQSESG